MLETVDDRFAHLDADTRILDFSSGQFDALVINRNGPR